MELAWTLSTFLQLTSEQLSTIPALRQQVFVVEQPLKNQLNLSRETVKFLKMRYDVCPPCAKSINDFRPTPVYIMKIQFSFVSFATVFAVVVLSLAPFLASPCSANADGGPVLKKHGNQLSLSYFSANAPVRFIVVEKSGQKLMVYEQQEKLKLLKTFVCATGENPGKKIISGDSRTPEGIYFITEIYEDKKITVFGSRAYHLDYPNIFDKHAGHLGDGIFIHGTNKTLIPFSTNGCIVLANKDLDGLATYLTVNDTPIIVVDKLPARLFGSDMKLSRADPRFKQILHELSLASAGISADNIDILSFLRFGSQAIASVKYKAYDGNSLEYRYHKRVYLTPSVSRQWRSVYSVESQDAVPTLLATQPVKNQVPKEPPAAPKPVAGAADIDQEVLAFVAKWKTAWTNKDIDTYSDCYSPSFRYGRLDRNGWLAKKTSLNKRYKYIKVALRDIAIKLTDTGANVSFFQDYQSDQYRISGTKQLQLVNKNNRWMIEKEVM